MSTEHVDEYTGRTVPWERAPLIERAMADAGSGPHFAVNPWANGIPMMAEMVRTRLRTAIEQQLRKDVVESADDAMDAVNFVLDGRANP